MSYLLHINNVSSDTNKIILDFNKITSKTLDLDNNISLASPLDQFEIRNLISLDINFLGNSQFSLTNIGTYLTISALLVLFLSLLSTNFNKVVANE